MILLYLGALLAIICLGLARERAKEEQVKREEQARRAEQTRKRARFLWRGTPWKMWCSYWWEDFKLNNVQCNLCQLWTEKHIQTPRLTICKQCVDLFTESSTSNQVKRLQYYPEAKALNLVSSRYEPRPEDWRAIRQKVFLLDGRKCEMCGAYPLHPHVHHIIPIRKLGTSHLNNLVVLCPECHQRQHSHFFLFTLCQTKKENTEYSEKHRSKQPTQKATEYPWTSYYPKDEKGRPIPIDGCSPDLAGGDFRRYHISNDPDYDYSDYLEGSDK